MRALLDLFRDATRSFWRYPDRMLAMVFHHYLGDPERAKRLAEEMRDEAALKEVDPEQATVRVKLTTERAKRRGDKVTVTDPVTWKVDQPMTIKHVVYGGTVRIRDWRWLWLRRKTIEVPTMSVRVP